MDNLSILGAKCLAVTAGHPARFSVRIFGDINGKLGEKEIFFLASCPKEDSFAVGKSYSLTGPFEVSLKTTERGDFVSLFIITRDSEECFPKKNGKILLTTPCLKTWGSFQAGEKINWARCSIKNNISGRLLTKEMPNIKENSSVLIPGGECDFYIAVSKKDGKKYLNCTIREDSVQYGFGPPKSETSQQPAADVKPAPAPIPANAEPVPAQIPTNAEPEEDFSEFSSEFSEEYF